MNFQCCVPPWTLTGHREGRPKGLKCREEHLWPCCNLIIWEHRGKAALNMSYQCFTQVHTTHILTVTTSHTHTVTRHVLSQHPQIRLHVTFPIKGFLERLNPRRSDIPASRAEHRLTFLCVSSERWLASGSATLIPDFHKIRSNQLQMRHTHRSRFCQSGIKHPLLWTPLTLSPSPREGTCQRGLTSRADLRRDKDNRWTQRELIKILISLSEEAQATEGT